MTGAETNIFGNSKKANNISPISWLHKSKDIYLVYIEAFLGEIINIDYRLVSDTSDYKYNIEILLRSLFPK